MINFLNVNPYVFGNVPIYGLLIAIGILIAVYYGITEGRRLGIWSDFIFWGAIVIVFLSIMGARLWFVIFNWGNGWTLTQIMGLDGNGLAGLAVQGGIMVAIISVYVYCKKKDVSVHKVFDLLAVGLFIGQIVGRWGNFFNQELYGPIVENIGLFRTILPQFIVDGMFISGQHRHPVFLYESLLNLVGLGVLLFIRFKHANKVKSGDFIVFYLVWYGGVRIFTESLRLRSGNNEPLDFLGLPVSILISILFVVGGLAYFFIKRKVSNLQTYQEILDEVKNDKFDTVIFDLDGTLIDTNDLIERGFIHTFTNYFPEHILTDEEIKSFIGPSLYDSLKKYETDETKIKEMIEYYKEFTNEYHDFYTKKISRVSEVLHILNKRGYKLAVVSSKEHEGVVKGINFAKISKYINYIIGVDQVKKPKPDPEGILKVLTKLGKTNRVLYVGDSVTDIQAGKNANVYTCACLYSVHKEDLLKEKAHYNINKFGDLLKLLVE